MGKSQMNNFFSDGVQKAPKPQPGLSWLKPQQGISWYCMVERVELIFSVEGYVCKHFGCQASGQGSLGHGCWRSTPHGTQVLSGCCACKWSSSVGLATEPHVHSVIWEFLCLVLNDPVLSPINSILSLLTVFGEQYHDPLLTVRFVSQTAG